MNQECTGCSHSSNDHSTYQLADVMGECSSAINWGALRCSSDPDQSLPEGQVADSRFPWLGVVQHSFVLAGATRFAITGAVLIHPGYAIAAADDIARIHPEIMENNTKLILWKGDKRYALDVHSYSLHPEYGEGGAGGTGGTVATLALLELVNTRGISGAGVDSPVLPVCLPVRGAGSFSELYAVKTTDDDGELHKELLKMNLVEEQDCEEFYYKAKLDHKSMSPVSPICARATAPDACVWEAGVALVAKQNWGQWTLLGFSMRGPGCGAPARFLPLHRYMPWIDEVVTRRHTDYEDNDRLLLFRRVSPIKLEMFDVTKTRVPSSQGQCERRNRGNVLYKDNSEVLANKNFVQGFFFVSVMQIMSIRCAVVNLEVNARSNAAVWVEHHCVRDYTGDREGFSFKDARSRNCFVYFKSVAMIEFRFQFSFRAIIEMTLYGVEETQRLIPNPWLKSDSTYAWQPTWDKLTKNSFRPEAFWTWHM
ncbi:uncharacterized protein LOC121735626 [Aricia agestis]|uniref:uncharacterized protein LOC121735626 n=1 Tax=Aricia agestis TaxID=91739 RepID=UPI001C208072|nr:uncharacterized protein LOC121735626 [Aricia agestis]